MVLCHKAVIFCFDIHVTLTRSIRCLEPDEHGHGTAAMAVPPIVGSSSCGALRRQPSAPPPGPHRGLAVWRVAMVCRGVLLRDNTSISGIVPSRGPSRSIDMAWPVHVGLPAAGLADGNGPGGLGSGCFSRPAAAYRRSRSYTAAVGRTLQLLPLSETTKVALFWCPPSLKVRRFPPQAHEVEVTHHPP